MSPHFKNILHLHTPVLAEDGWTNKELRFVYQDSELLRMSANQQVNGKEVIMLFTDIDHTFYRYGKEKATASLTKEARHNEWPIVAISGCSYADVLHRIKRGELPYFQVIAGSVGTEIWVLNQSRSGKPEYRQDTVFKKLLMQSHFDRAALVTRSYHMMSELKAIHPEWRLRFQHPRIEQRLQTTPDLLYQPFKISFHFFASADPEGPHTVQKAVQKYFPHQSVVVCGEIGYNSQLPASARIKKYCLDILPTAKSGALQYLRTLLGVQKGLVAGDSGNDIEMLLESGDLNVVLVGGHESLAKAALSHTLSTSATTYIEDDPELQAAESILRATKKFAL